MKIVVVGATGLIGQAIIENLLTVGEVEIIAVASSRSQGKVLFLGGQQLVVQALTESVFQGCDMAFFSAGGAVSEQYIPMALKYGVRVIDNSSHFRMHEDVPLVAAGVNQSKACAASLIANPNCSTIQLAVAIHPLLSKTVVTQLNVVSMQSISGAGAGAIEALCEHSDQVLKNRVKQAGMAFDIDPSIDVWMENGDCKEEWKIKHELPKILQTKFPLFVTTVRVPVLYGHTQAVTIHCQSPITKEDLLHVWGQKSNIICYNQTAKLSPMCSARGNSDVHIGRLRQEDQLGKVWSFIVISDNILRGGAINAFEIMKDLLEAKNEQ